MEHTNTNTNIDIDLLIKHGSGLAVAVREQYVDSKTLNITKTFSDYILNKDDQNITEDTYISLIIEASRLCFDKECEFMINLLDSFITFVIKNDLIQKYFDLTPMLYMTNRGIENNNQFLINHGDKQNNIVKNELDAYAKLCNYNIYKIGLIDENKIDNIDNLVISLCNVSLFKRLVKNGKIDLSADSNRYLKEACRYENYLIAKYILSNIIIDETIIATVRSDNSSRICKYLVKLPKFIDFVNSLDNVGFMVMIRDMLYKGHETDDFKDLGIVIKACKIIKGEIPLDNDIVDILGISNRYNILNALIDLTDKDPNMLNQFLNDYINACLLYNKTMGEIGVINSRLRSSSQLHKKNIFYDISNIDDLCKRYNLKLNENQINRIKTYKRL